MSSFKVYAARRSFSSLKCCFCSSIDSTNSLEVFLQSRNPGAFLFCSVLSSPVDLEFESDK